MDQRSRQLTQASRAATTKMQLRQDITGSISNLQRIVVRHRNDVAQVQEHWQDVRAKQFLETELPPVEETIKRLLVYLQKSFEFAESVAQQTRDEILED